MSTELTNKIGGATKWSSITELMAKLISPIVNMVLARLLTPEAFGIVATITMVISFAEIFADAGFQKYLIQHEFRDEEELDQCTTVAFWTNLLVSVTICTVIFFFRHPIATAVGSPGLGNSISIASILVILSAFSSIQMARFKRAFDFKTLFFVRIGTALIPLVVTVPLAVVFHNYWALLFGNFASQLFNAVALTWKSKWKPTFFYSFRLLKKMFSFSAWTLLETVSVWLTEYIGIFIVGSHLSEYYLGLYKTSMSTVSSYMAIITAALTPVLFSALSRYQDDEVEYRKTYFSFQRMAATLVVPMGVGIFLFSDLVTYILLGSQWGEASGFVGLWGLTGSLIIIFSHFSSEVYRSKGKPKISLIMQLVHLAFVVPVLLIFVRYDFQTLYTARSLVRLQGVASALIMMHILYHFRVSEVVKNVFPMLFSSLIMGVVGFALKQLSDHIVWHFIVIFICVIVYFAVLLGVFRKIRREVIASQIVQKLLSKTKK